LRVWGLGFRVEGLGLRICGLGFGVKDLNIRVEALDFQVNGLDFRLEGIVFNVKRWGKRTSKRSVKDLPIWSIFRFQKYATPLYMYLVQGWGFRVRG